MDIQPVFVTLEQAKLLKAKGFDELCDYSYEGNVFSKTNRPWRNSEDPTEYAVAEQWMVTEWLRKKHNWFINVGHLTENNKYYYSVKNINPELDLPIHFPSSNKDGCLTPQEAYSDAINYVLNTLI